MNKLRDIRTLSAALGYLLACLVTGPAVGAVLVVDSLLDDSMANLAGNDTCELREAVRNINAGSALHEDCPAGNGVDDEILLSIAGTIVLVGAAEENAAASGDLDLLEDVVIRNTSDGEVIIDGGGNDRIFDGSVFNPIDWSIEGGEHGIVIQNGVGGFAGGCIASVRDSSLTLDSVTVTGCEVGFDGAGLNTGGDTLIVNSVFSNNLQTESNNGGGGIKAFAGTLEIRDSVIAGNEGFRGGGVQVAQEANLILDNSLVTDNHARESGGGVDLYFPENPSEIRNGSRIEGNSAVVEGGGVAMLGNYTVLSELLVEHSDIGRLDGANQTEGQGGGLAAIGGKIVLGEGTQVVGNQADGSGGGISMRGDAEIEVRRTVLAQNHASRGGGIYLYQTNGLIEDSLLVGNLADGSGGGLSFQVDKGETLTVQRTIWRTNQAAVYAGEFTSGGGGAIHVDGFGSGQLDVSESEFSGNQVLGDSSSYYGGAIRPAHDVSIRNSTFSGNSAPNGGAVGWNNGPNNIIVNNATFYANASTNDQGAQIGSAGTIGSLQVTNSILVFAAQGQHCYPDTHTGIQVDQTNVKWQGGNCDQAVEGDPMLGPLADNGGTGPGAPDVGYPQTHAIIDENSAALDNPLTVDCEPADQRGVLRNDVCDQGAYEAVEFIVDEVFKDRFESN